MRLAALLLPLAGLTGCGPDCRSSCDRLFGDGDGQCNLEVPGYPGEEIESLANKCVAHCEEAMTKTGEIGDYNPNAKGSNDDTLANEKQAALWMDCVAETACDSLEDNYCAPTTNFPQ